MPEKEINANMRGDENSDVDQTVQAKEVLAGAAREDAEVARLAADLDDLRRTLQRRQADFENYRKRVEKERQEDWRRATARLIEALIPVIDSFEHALAAHKEAEYEGYRKGFELIYKQLSDQFARLGLERLNPIGKHFDPHFHQAMERTETTEHEDGTILEVFQPGYVFHERVLRPAMVRVAVQGTQASKKTVN